MKTVIRVTIGSGYSIGGFTLVELLLALAIAGIIAAFAISISSSISGLSKQAMTKARMETIAARRGNIIAHIKYRLRRPLLRRTLYL